MLTSRSIWFLIPATLILVVGTMVIPYYTVAPALLGITLVAWFAYECCAFQTASCAALARLRVTRQVLQGGREVPMLWAGLPFEVRARIENPSGVAIPFAVLEDRPVAATRTVDGSNRLFSSLPPGSSVEIVYRLVSPSPGVLRFEGLRIRVADLQGFFYRRVFLREGIEFLVLPPLMDDEGRQRATKRFNTLPAPGIHRLRRPGSGSELLDLRDYRAGDPPKMIAWKASARRDRLITKEFENDVPVRCMLFLDISEGVRLGPPGNTLLTRLAGVAAVVAQSSAANRDLVGLATVDERETKAISPARTKLHMINMLRRLAEVSALQPGVAGVPPQHLTQRAYPLAQELYPELMSSRVNSMPFSRLWIPLLDRKWGWLPIGAILIGLALFWLGSTAIAMGLYDREGLASTQVMRGARTYFLWSMNRAAALTPSDWPLLVKLGWMNLMLLLTFFPPAILGAVFWFFHSIRGWFGERKRELTQRKQLAALFSLQDGAGADAVERYIHDDEAYAGRVAAFLQQHLLRCPVPLYDERGRYRFRCAGKAPVLAEAMIRAVGRARDNELYVVLADLAELGNDLAPVVRACRVARSRHHHVLVIVPWPADVPSPDVTEVEPEAAPVKEAAVKKFRKGKHPEPPLAETRAARHRGLMQAVRRQLTRQYHESFRALRRQLGQVGATVMRVNDGDPVQLVLDRLDRIRGMRSRR